MCQVWAQPPPPAPAPANEEARAQAYLAEQVTDTEQNAV